MKTYYDVQLSEDEISDPDDMRWQPRGFYGVSTVREGFDPVSFTDEPYFDCGRTNTWIFSLVSAAVDQIPRYLEWFHLRRDM